MSSTQTPAPPADYLHKPEAPRATGTSPYVHVLIGAVVAALRGSRFAWMLRCGGACDCGEPVGDEEKPEGSRGVLLFAVGAPLAGRKPKKVLRGRRGFLRNPVAYPNVKTDRTRLLIRVPARLGGGASHRPLGDASGAPALRDALRLAASCAQINH